MRYLRNRPNRSETLCAAVMASGLAAGVGLVAFYLTRTFLAREPTGGVGVERLDGPQAGER
ncbi:MAG: hypothetical protein O2992_06765 [Gemmatimonadetes bacterium]|nr:hypothetical protein [Gemmatimonadota bacterium]